LPRTAETLETLGRVQYRDDMKHCMVKCAHPHRLPSGDIVGMAADFTPVLEMQAHGVSRLRLPEVTLYRQSPWRVDRRTKIASVPYMRPTAPTWIHDVGGEGEEGFARHSQRVSRVCGKHKRCWAP
jgi:hypothetical protein